MRYLENKNNIEIDLDIYLETPLNINVEPISNEKYKDGSKKYADICQLRYGRYVGEVYIPGSSLRGAIYNKYEKIASFIGYKPEIDDLFSSEKEKRISRIRIEDAFVPNEKYRDEMNNSNNCKKVLDEKHIYTPMTKGKSNPLVGEIIKKKEHLTTRISIRNTNYMELYILLNIIKDSHNNEFRVGSNKSRGLGLVKLNFNNVYLELNVSDNNYLEKDMLELFEIDDNKSIKVLDKYIRKIYKLKKECLNLDFKDIDSNEFLKYIQKKVR